MIIRLKNIGKIKETTVEIKGITVIGGNNNTGKSTVGKTLYAVFNSMKDVTTKIRQERINSIFKTIQKYFIFNNNIQPRTLINFSTKLVDSNEEKKIDDEFILNEFKHLLSNDDTLLPPNVIQGFEIYKEQIKSTLNLSNETILAAYITKALNIEFSNQIGNIFSDEGSLIELTIKNNTTKINIENNKVTYVENPLLLMTEPIYIDDPYLLDLTEYDNQRTSENSFNFYHRSSLKNKILNNETNPNVVDEILTQQKLNKIYEKIRLVCDGDIIKVDNSLGFKKQGSDKILNFTNLSTGLKSFAILKNLLQNGIIETNGTIILDEPEVHLHPEWQIIFAELIVLLHKEFKLHILLNTHSPYFLRAIEVYAAKYEIADKCKYYLSELETQTAKITDVSEETEKIYQKLSQPLQTLSDEEINA